MTRSTLAMAVLAAVLALGATASDADARMSRRQIIAAKCKATNCAPQPTAPGPQRY